MQLGLDGDDRRPDRAHARSVQELSALPADDGSRDRSDDRPDALRARGRGRARGDARAAARAVDGGRARPCPSSASPAPAAPARAPSPTSSSRRFLQYFPELRDRRARGRPDPAPHRRRAARRPDPDEQPARRARLHALDGDAPAQPRDERDARRRGRLPARARASTSSIVETAGIGQSDSEIVDLVDVPLYVMTSEFGAAEPAREDRHARPRRDRRHQQVRQARAPTTRCATCASSGGATTSRSTLADDEVPVFPTIASQFDDPGVTWLFVDLCRALGRARRRRRRARGTRDLDADDATSRSATC